MGCQQSKPIGRQDGKLEIDNSKKLISGIGQTERLMSAQLKRQQQAQMQASNTTATVSLDVDEEISTKAPNLKPDGTMKPEEVVRRTSSSLETSSIALGNKEKGGKVVQVQVRGQIIMVLLHQKDSHDW
jgi:FKBP-type peptidyl-prolyl cis-trans isomerase